MVKVNLDSNRDIEIDHDTVLDGASFDSIFKALSGSSFEDVLEVSYFLRSNYTQAEKLLNLANGKCSDTVQQDNLKIQRIGLMIQHGLDVKDNLEDLQYSSDKRIEFLRGIFCINNNLIDDAQFSFEKIGYKKGIERCAVMKNVRNEMAISDDPIVKCYYSSKNWNSFDQEVSNKNFMYIIGKSTEYNDINNIDVQIKHIEEDIQKSSNKSNFAELINRLTNFLDSGINSPQILYYIGKIYHLIDEYDHAAQWYNKALNADKNYLPAKFNLARIKGTTVDEKCNDTIIKDYNAIISLKNQVFDIDLNNCSGDIRKLYWIISQARNMNKSIALELDDLLGRVDSIAIENNKAILLENDESVNILENLLKNAEFNYIDYIRYNLGIIKKDVKLLDECKFPEAQLYSDFFNKNINTTDIRLKAYLTNNPDLIQDQSDQFFLIFKGNMLLNEYINTECGDSTLLEKAESMFYSNINSPYCINGLGICAMFRNNLQVALKLFNQIATEITGVFKSLGICYLIQKDYNKAIECFLKESRDVLSQSDNEILLNLVEKTKDLKNVDTLIERGFEQLKKTKALILIERGDLKSVADLGIKDEEVLRKIDELKTKEEERKRKMEEIEEYRKKRVAK